MARRRMTVQRAAPRRKLVWARFEEQLSIATPVTNSTTFSILGEFNADYGAIILGATVTRIILSEATRLTGGVIGTEYDIYRGIIRSSSNAAPNPVTEENADWMWWKHDALVSNAVATGDAGTASMRTYQRWDWDLKGQRKFEDLESELLYNISTNAPASDFNISGNILLKLP